MNESLASALNRPYAGNPLSQWLIAAAVAIGGTIVLGIAKRLAVRRLETVAERTDTDLDDAVVDLLRRTARFFLLALAVFVAHHWVKLNDTAELYVQRAVKVALWLQVGLWLQGLLLWGIQRMVRGRAAHDPARTMGASVLGFIGQAVVWTLILLLTLQALGQDVTTLIASLGVGGIAVALALQNILGDLFASITILLDKPFVLGDAIVLGDFQGTVERIGIKTTRLRSVTGEEIVMGNSDLVSSRLRNFKRMQERRNLFAIGVTYQTPEKKLARIPSMIREIVEATPETRFERAHLKTFGDFALVFEIVYFVKSSDMQVFMDAQQAINIAIWKRFESEGIDFAYPTQTVHHPGEKAAASNGGTALQARSPAPASSQGPSRGGS